MRNLEALLAFIAGRAATPHSWGREGNDCVSFAAGAVEAQTGKNPLGRLRWRSPRGALRVVTRLGGMAAALDARFDRVAPGAAMRGDIAGVADPVFGIHPMIVEGDTLVAPGDRGLVRLPRAAMIAAWSVGARRDV
jgi:hypothetical protein